MKTRQTNGPFTKLGRIAFRRYPFAMFDDVVKDALLQTERDLRSAPTPISGGMRKALHKETGAQNALRFRTSAAHDRARRDYERQCGLFVGSCQHCRHVHFFDEVEDDATAPPCDRCKRPIWK